MGSERESQTLDHYLPSLLGSGFFPKNCCPGTVFGVHYLGVFGAGEALKFNLLKS